MVSEKTALMRAWKAANPEGNYRAAYQRSYRANHLEQCHAYEKKYRSTARAKEIAKAGQRKWRRDNLEKSRALCSKWKRDNPQKARAIERRWKLKHPETQKRKAQREYLKNKQKYLERVKRWRIKNRDRFLQVHTVQQARRRTLKANAKGDHNVDQWLARVEFFGWRCWLCKKELTARTLTQDHVIPLSKGGSNWPANLRPACHSCNASKNAKKGGALSVSDQPNDKHRTWTCCRI